MTQKLIYITTGSSEEAKSIGRALVEERVDVVAVEVEAVGPGPDRRLLALGREQPEGADVEALVVGDCFLAKADQDPALKLDYKDAFALD